MIPDQRHYSEPFVCHDNLLITESTVCFRRGSTSLVEILRCRAKTMSQSPCYCPSQGLASTKSTESLVHATDHLCSSSAQNPSLLSPLSSPHQYSDHDSASHFNSPLPPLNLQPPSEPHLSVPRSPQPHRHCRACMSLLLGDRTKGGGSLGHTHGRSLSTTNQFTPASKPGSPTSPHLSRSPSVTLPPPSASPSPPLSNSQTTLLTPPSHLSPPSQIALPRSLYEGADLTLLNHCLHHIINRRTSSPTLSDRISHYGGTGSSAFERIDKSQSLEVPLFCSPNLDRNLLLPSHNSKDQPDPLVG